jgi:diguanylate cyclase
MPAQLSDDHATIRRWAARAWLELESAGVPPTPANFELWYRHVNGSTPELSREIAASLDTAATIPAAALKELHAKFPPVHVEADDFAEQASAIQQAAQVLVDQVAGNREHLRQYGATLTNWSAKLAQDQTIETLTHAVATLSAETARAGERNRELERQLSASTARISRLKDSIQDLKRAATTDLLTGLFNRRAFSARLQRALLDARTDGSPASLLMIDVDHFKQVNDTYGHATGDLFLKLIGRVLADSLTGRDTAARYGGEEFAVLLMRADLKAATTVANRLRMTLEDQPLTRKRTAGEALRITVSIGVAQFRSDETATSLLARADAALYQAKDLGRNRVCAAH